MKILPMANRVLIKQDDEADETITDGGIIIPPTVDPELDTPLFGVVAAVGPGMFLDTGSGRYPMDVKPGDRVMFLGRIGKKIKDSEGVEFMLTREEDLLAKIEE